MKRITVNAILLMAATFLCTTASYAQQLAIHLKADVPFEFSVGQKTFPAGEYQFAEVAPHTLALQDGDRRFKTAVMTEPLIRDAQGSTPKLKFEAVDGHFVLTEVWAEDGTGYKLPSPKRPHALTQSRPAEAEMQTLVSSSARK